MRFDLLQKLADDFRMFVGEVVLFADVFIQIVKPDVGRNSALFFQMPHIAHQLPRPFTAGLRDRRTEKEGFFRALNTSRTAYFVLRTEFVEKYAILST